MSASLPDADVERSRPPGTQLRDFDVVLPAIVGAVALASLGDRSPLSALGLVSQAAALAVVVAGAAWLLLADSPPGTEQRVFTVAAVLLLGGIADYLSISALVVGLAAGLFWGTTGGVAREYVERDLNHLRQPLVVLVLLTAGARMILSPALAAVALAYFVLRLAGKLAGAWIARRTPGLPLPEDLGATLVPPGVFGVAFAVNAAPMLGEGADRILAAAVLGTIASQLAAGLARPRELAE
jgi:hypothetical protein